MYRKCLRGLCQYGQRQTRMMYLNSWLSKHACARSDFFSINLLLVLIRGFPKKPKTPLPREMQKAIIQDQDCKEMPIYLV